MLPVLREGGARDDRPHTTAMSEMGGRKEGDVGTDDKRGKGSSVGGMVARRSRTHVAILLGGKYNGKRLKDWDTVPNLNKSEAPRHRTGGKRNQRRRTGL